MKKLFLAVLLVGGLYYGYNHVQNPTRIEQPVFSEMRIDMTAGSRTINVLLFGKMADETDCRERAERVWRKLIDCKDCSIQLVDCKGSLSARYEQLFEDVPINMTYLSLTRGSRYERDGRMVIWGVTGKEGAELCEIVRGVVQSRYSGKSHCVPAR